MKTQVDLQGYIAPEILNEENHSFESDYYSLGIVAYELLFGKRPFNSIRRKELKVEIQNKEIILNKNDFHITGSNEMADFINLLLKRNRYERLGYKSIEELKSHKLFKYFNWKDLYLKKIKSPFQPSHNIEDNFNLLYAEQQEKIGIDTQIKYIEIMSDESYHKFFENWKFFNRFASKNYYEFINPHSIYEELETKEINAFECGDKLFD